MAINFQNNLFELEDIPEVYDAYQRHCTGDSESWEKIKYTCMRLPNWYNSSLDPDSNEYREQQHTLWKAIVDIDREYDPKVDEQCTDITHIDVIRFPGGFSNRDPEAVSRQADHDIATGMFMKYSGIRPGQYALEYGAGFGGAALRMARLGVNVDTVDVSEYFCEAIKTQADFYGVPLTSFEGEFGLNPRGDKKYDLIFFYESFHHCLEFRKVVSQIKEHLVDGGKIMLAGEPVIELKNNDIPYDWGIRLCAENISIMRFRHWFELGFLEDYLVQIFVNAGFFAEKMVCPVSVYGSGHIFKHRQDTIHIGTHWLPYDESRSWHGPEPTGRWTTEKSYITLDTSDTFSEIKIEMSNHHLVNQAVVIEYGPQRRHIVFSPGESKTIVIDAREKVSKLFFISGTKIPAKVYKSTDTRSLGIFVNSISYVK